MVNQGPRSDQDQRRGSVTKGRSTDGYQRTAAEGSTKFNPEVLLTAT
jgi:hypothetical protein